MSSTANSFGTRFVFTSFGESHGKAVGVVIDGCPAGIDFDMDLLINELKRRRPGKHDSQTSIVSDRNEKDEPEILSGIYQGKTLGTPIAILVYNKDQRSEDYNEIAKEPRVGHADDTWKSKFSHVDPRGGGRSSGRETLARVMAGSVAQMLLKKMSPNLKVTGFTSQIGPVSLDAKDLKNLSTDHIDKFLTRMPSQKKDKELQDILLKAKQEGKSYGGLVELWIENPPKDLGQPVFHKLKSDLAGAFMSVGATSGVDFGDGFSVVDAEGSEFHQRSDVSQYGGIRGGISTGEKISFRISFKPTATVLHHAKKGRHDPCIVPRAVPVIESMAYLVIADHMLWKLSDQV
ncbi:MAG: chorismate synthase [Bdellovibrionaceae bacterium]|nr:chorismate synthase [Pseudobdellovibrionaceae bacterium]